jgi:hypothetical protein
MEKLREIEKDILRTYYELKEENENFGGHYKNNPYNGINIFGNSVHIGSFDTIEILKQAEASGFIKNGVGVAELCKLAQSHSDALDAGMEPVDYVKTECPEILQLLNKQAYDGIPIIKQCIEKAFTDSIAFSQLLLKILDDIVLK